MSMKASIGARRRRADGSASPPWPRALQLNAAASSTSSNEVAAALSVFQRQILCARGPRCDCKSFLRGTSSPSTGEAEAVAAAAAVSASCRTSSDQGPTRIAEGNDRRGDRSRSTSTSRRPMVLEDVVWRHLSTRVAHPSRATQKRRRGLHPAQHDHLRDRAVGTGKTFLPWRWRPRTQGRRDGQRSSIYPPRGRGGGSGLGSARRPLAKIESLPAGPLVDDALHD